METCYYASSVSVTVMWLVGIILLQNNPSDYNYFFDTSRRRTCYIAPERFKSDSVGSDQCDIFTTRPKEELTHAMDVFSLAYGFNIRIIFIEGKQTVLIWRLWLIELNS